MIGVAPLTLKKMLLKIDHFWAPPWGFWWAKRVPQKGAQTDPKVPPGTKKLIFVISSGAQCQHTFFLWKTTLGGSQAHFSLFSPRSRQRGFSTCRSISLSKHRWFVNCVYFFSFFTPEAWFLGVWKNVKKQKVPDHTFGPKREPCWAPFSFKMRGSLWLKPLLVTSELLKYIGVLPENWKAHLSVFVKNWKNEKSMFLWFLLSLGKNNTLWGSGHFVVLSILWKCRWFWKFWFLWMLLPLGKNHQIQLRDLW